MKKTKINKPEYVIYTDGCCLKNPGDGGWAAIIIGNKGHQEICGGEPATTNNRMEMRAAINALKLTPDGSKVLIHSDSQYLIKGITKWIKNWKKSGWISKTTSKGVLNKDLWEELDVECQKRQADWKWVRGHSGNKFNNRCDELADTGARSARSTSNATDNGRIPKIGMASPRS